MSSNTPNLDLLKMDRVADGNKTFNIETMLNQNWDKIDEAFGNMDFEVIDAYDSTDKTLPPAADALRRGLETKQNVLRLADNYLAASVLVNAPAADNGGRSYPDGVSMFKVSSSAGGWPTANGYVLTFRAGSGGYQIFYEMYTGAVATEKTARQWTRSKRDSNAFWQDWARGLTEIDLKLPDNYKAPTAAITEFPEGRSVFFVGGGTGGQGAAWASSAGATEQSGFVETIRTGNAGYQTFTEMYSGASTTDTLGNRQFKRVKRDSNSFWQLFEKELDADDLTAHNADYVKHPADGGTTEGTASIYTATSTPNPAAFVDRMGIVITAHVDSAVNPQLAWGTLAAKNLVKANGNPAVLKKDGIYTFRYNLAKGNFVLQGEGGEYGNVTAEDVKSGVEFGTETGIKLGTATLFQLSNLVGGEGLSISSTSTASATTTTLVKKKEVKINQSGAVRTRFELTASAYGASAQIFKNDVAVGTLRSVGGNQTMTFTEDINVVKGDYIQLFVRASDSNYAASVRNFSVSVALNNDMLSMLGTVIL